jgi:hypothetical protein
MTIPWSRIAVGKRFARQPARAASLIHRSAGLSSRELRPAVGQNTHHRAVPERHPARTDEAAVQQDSRRALETARHRMAFALT